MNAFHVLEIFSQGQCPADLFLASSVGIKSYVKDNMINPFCQVDYPAVLFPVRFDAVDKEFVVALDSWL